MHTHSFAPPRDVAQRKDAAFASVVPQRAQRLMQVGRMASSVAHDMNDLLTVIDASAGLAAADLPAGHSAQRDLETIGQACRRAGSLIRQLLAFVSEQQPQPFAIHLGEALANIDLLIERLVGGSIALGRQVAPDLWPVMAAPGQIEQVLINLLTNARDAMPGGGVLSIRASNHTDAAGRESVLLEVSDSGVGISAELREHLFAPFYTTKEPGKGAGLGLVICASIVERLGGRIELESEVGRGTTARVLLPRAII